MPDKQRASVRKQVKRKRAEFDGVALSESSLARDWLTPEEDEAWKGLSIERQDLSRKPESVGRPLTGRRSRNPKAACAAGGRGVASPDAKQVRL